MGADVVRIESNVFPDILRRIAPFRNGVEGLNRSGMFASINGGKRSVLLNLAKPEAAQIVRQLVEHWQPDIVLENFVTGTMKRRGMAYEDLRAVKPDLIYASLSLLGQTGPDAWHRGWGPTMQARTGVTWLSGYRETGTPVALGGTFPDFTLAGLAVDALLIALWHREETSEGQYIDFAQNEGVAITISDALIDFTMNGRVQSMRGNRQPGYAPQGVYRCAGDDSWVAISVATDDEWASLAEAIGRADLMDQRFADSLERMRHHDELDALITGWTRERSSHDVQRTLQRAGVAAGVALNIEELVADPQLLARGFFVQADHEEIGRSGYGGLPLRIEGVEPRADNAPLFGDHSRPFYADVLGMSDEEFSRLSERASSASLMSMVMQQVIY
jgi:benzylsuccinate CoA-transferase BbsF subunit